MKCDLQWKGGLHLYEIPDRQREYDRGKEGDEEFVEELGQEVGDGAIQAIVPLPDEQWLLKRKRWHV